MHQNLRRPATPQEVHDDIEHLRVQNGGCLEIFAGGCGASKDENPGANNGANAERGERPRPQGFLETVLRMLRISNEFVDRFSGEELVGQS